MGEHALPWLVIVVICTLLIGRPVNFKGRDHDLPDATLITSMSVLSFWKTYNIYSLDIAHDVACT